MDQNSPSNSPALSETLVIIGFDIGRTFIFYDQSGKPSDNWMKIFQGLSGWTTDQFADYKRPLGWVAKLSMQDCPNLDMPKVPEEERKLTQLAKAFKELGAELVPESVEAIFFMPGVGVMQFQLKYARSEISARLSELNEKSNRDRIRPLLEDLVAAAAGCYTALLETQKSLIKGFKAVDRKKSGYLVFFLLSFVDKATFNARAGYIRDSLANTEEQKRIFDERARVGYGNNTSVFIEWSEALVTGNSAEEKQQIETNFIIAMASWSSLSLMERHSAMDSFDAFAKAVGANTKQVSVNDIHIRTTAYRDVSDAILPIRWTVNSRDLHLLEAIHRNWSSDRLREVIAERMQALTLHHQRIQSEQRDQADAAQAQLNQRLTVFAITVAVSTLASAAADVINLWNVNGPRSVVLSLAFPALGITFLIIYLRPKRPQQSNATSAPIEHR